MQQQAASSLVQLSAFQRLQELTLRHPCHFTDDSVGSLTALTQLTRLGLSEGNPAFSTTMQQQLLQQFGREELDGSDEMFNIIDEMFNIIDTVGTLCCGYAVQHFGVL